MLSNNRPALDDLSVDHVRSRLDYDLETGIFTWRKRPVKTIYDKAWNARYARKRAGSADEQGYLQISIDGRTYKAHRLAWLYMTGQWPLDVVDHENNNRADNRWVNLRVVSHRQNTLNRRKPGSSKYPGVYRDRKNRKFVAQIHARGKSRHLGSFDDELEAAAAYQKAAGLADGSWKTLMTRGILSSKYPGVCWNRQAQKFHARIQVNGKRYHLGCFDDELEAADAYRKAKLQLTAMS